MPGPSNKDSAQNFGLTPREIELTIKAMITILQNNEAKIDFEKLAQMTHYSDAAAANKNWAFTARKLKAFGSNTNGAPKSSNRSSGETGDGKAGGKNMGKRQAVDPATPPAKRGRVRRNQDDVEEQAVGVKAEAEAYEN